MLQSFVLPGGVGPSAPSEMGDSTSMASLNHMASGILQFGDETPANAGTVEGNFNDQNPSLQHQGTASGELHPQTQKSSMNPAAAQGKMASIMTRTKGTTGAKGAQKGTNVNF